MKKLAIFLLILFFTFSCTTLSMYYGPSAADASRLEDSVVLIMPKRLAILEIDGQEYISKNKNKIFDMSSFFDREISISPGKKIIEFGFILTKETVENPNDRPSFLPSSASVIVFEQEVVIEENGIYEPVINLSSSDISSYITNQATIEISFKPMVNGLRRVDKDSVYLQFPWKKITDPIFYPDRLEFIGIYDGSIIQSSLESFEAESVYIHDNPIVSLSASPAMDSFYIIDSEGAVLSTQLELTDFSTLYNLKSSEYSLCQTVEYLILYTIKDVIILSKTDYTIHSTYSFKEIIDVDTVFDSNKLLITEPSSSQFIDISSSTKQPILFSSIVHSAAVHPNGGVLAFAPNEGSIQLYDVNTEKKISLEKIFPYYEQVRKLGDIRFSGDGNILFSLQSEMSGGILSGYVLSEDGIVSLDKKVFNLYEEMSFAVPTNFSDAVDQSKIYIAPNSNQFILIYTSRGQNAFNLVGFEFLK
jgi:WD40 repeat protein